MREYTYVYVQIRESSFSGNTSTSALVASASNVSVFNCSFIGNVATGPGYGAAITAFDMIFLNVTSIRFDRNIANQSTGRGGAIHIRTTSEKIKVTCNCYDPVLLVLIKDCMFRNNSAALGGAVFAFQLQSSVVLSKSTFVGNQACIGAAVYAGDSHSMYNKQSYNLDLIDVHVEIIENQYIPCGNGAEGVWNAKLDKIISSSPQRS